MDLGLGPGSGFHSKQQQDPGSTTRFRLHRKRKTIQKIVLAQDKTQQEKQPWRVGERRDPRSGWWVFYLIIFRGGGRDFYVGDP